MFRDIYAYLRSEKNFDYSVIKSITDYERKNSCTPYAALEQMRLLPIEDIREAVMKVHGIRPFTDDVLACERHSDVPLQFMLQNGLIAIPTQDPATKDSVTLVLITDPRQNIPALDALKKIGLRGKMRIRWIPNSVFEDWKKVNAKSYNSEVLRELSSQAGSVEAMVNESNPLDDELNLEGSDDRVIVDLVNEIIRQAISLGASDIHIEPREGGCVIRYRIDGVLAVSNAINDISQVRRMINRIKVLGGIDVNNARIPQSGKIKFGPHDIRVSTMPAVSGEKVVLRILNGGGGVIRNLKELGVPKEAEEKLRKLFTRPYGIILVSGPTGSGKSSTLAAILQELSTDDTCMITIEDPVEYRIPGAVQVNINDEAGLTFHETLREVLRQDPNIMMVGEIRDKETAEIAMQAANTGHLVFSTIHTNSAASAITRMNDMGVDGYLVADNIICIISQSLVRRLCPHCREEHIITKDDCEKYDAPSRLVGKHAYVPSKHGCAKCNGTGYAGRTIAFEILEMTPKIMQAVHDKLPTAEIEKIAEALAFRKKIDYAYSLVEDGITSLHEVRRIIGGTELEEVNH